MHSDLAGTFPLAYGHHHFMHEPPRGAAIKDYIKGPYTNNPYAYSVPYLCRNQFGSSCRPLRISTGVPDSLAEYFIYHSLFPALSAENEMNKEDVHIIKELRKRYRLYVGQGIPDPLPILPFYENPAFGCGQNENYLWNQFINAVKNRNCLCCQKKYLFKCADISDEVNCPCKNCHLPILHPFNYDHSNDCGCGLRPTYSDLEIALQWLKNRRAENGENVRRKQASGSDTDLRYNDMQDRVGKPGCSVELAKVSYQQKSVIGRRRKCRQAGVFNNPRFCTCQRDKKPSSESTETDSNDENPAPVNSELMEKTIQTDPEPTKESKSIQTEYDSKYSRRTGKKCECKTNCKKINCISRCQRPNYFAQTCSYGNSCPADISKSFKKERNQLEEAIPSSNSPKRKNIDYERKQSNENDFSEEEKIKGPQKLYWCTFPVQQPCTCFKNISTHMSPDKPSDKKPVVLEPVQRMPPSQQIDKGLRRNLLLTEPQNKPFPSYSSRSTKPSEMVRRVSKLKRELNLKAVAPEHSPAFSRPKWDSNKHLNTDGVLKKYESFRTKSFDPMHDNHHLRYKPLFNTSSTMTGKSGVSKTQSPVTVKYFNEISNDESKTYGLIKNSRESSRKKKGFPEKGVIAESEENNSREEYGTKRIRDSQEEYIGDSNGNLSNLNTTTGRKTISLKSCAPQTSLISELNEFTGEKHSLQLSRVQTYVLSK